MLPQSSRGAGGAAWVVAIAVVVVTVVVVDSGVHGDQSTRAVSHARLTGLANAARHRQRVWEDGPPDPLGREAERVAQARLPTGVLHCHNRFPGQSPRKTLRNNGIHFFGANFFADISIVYVIVFFFSLLNNAVRKIF